MKQYSKTEMVSLFVAAKAQYAVTEAYNLPHYGIAVTIEETADFIGSKAVLNWSANHFEGKFCLAIWKLESCEPFAVTPVDLTLVADEVYKALHG